jgi:hypothetical protein
VAILTVVLACFALGALQTPPRQLAAEPDARGNRVTGLYSQTDDRFIGPTQIAFTSGAVYEGDLEGHRFNGHGILRGETVNEAGERMVWRFEGQFVDGHLEGEGSYLDHLGTYAGTFSNSQPQGYGIYSSNSGWRYEGEFKAGAMTGEGTVYTADGNATTGRFEDGLQVSIE